MLQVREYDEDPALFSDQNDDGSDHHHHHLLMVNNSIPRREYQVNLQNSAVVVSSRSATSQGISWQALIRTPKQVLVDLFLPLGFPHSVDPSYLPYQFYDSLQGLCSYLRGVVSTSAVLAAAGVGDADATSLGAAMTWALKDGLGMIGGLVFSYHASPFFDAYVLEFRLFADFINDVGLTLDMMAPLVPSSCLLLLMSFSTLSKTMCGMSAGATKSSITVHLALEGNMADLNAKEGTQETLVSLLGMMLGVQLAKQLQRYESQTFAVGDHTVPVELALSWLIFLFLTWLHMWANYRGVKLLKLTSLNRERARVALEQLVTSMAKHYQYRTNPEAPAMVNLEKETIPHPNEVEESMIRATMTMLFPNQQLLALGVPLLDILHNKATNKFLLKEFEQERYILGIRPKGNKNNNKSQVLVTLRTGATPQDELKAYVHSMLLRKCLDADGKTNITSANVAETNQLIQITHAQLSPLFGGKADIESPLIQKLAAQGWDMEARFYLGFGRKRTAWESKDD